MNFNLDNLERRFLEQVNISRINKNSNGLSTQFEQALDIVNQENKIFIQNLYNLIQPDFTISLVEYTRYRK